MDATEEQVGRATQYAIAAQPGTIGQNMAARRSALAAIIDGDRREAELRAEIERLREAMRTAAAALILIDKALNADKGTPDA